MKEYIVTGQFLLNRQTRVVLQDGEIPLNYDRSGAHVMVGDKKVEVDGCLWVLTPVEKVGKSGD